MQRHNARNVVFELDRPEVHEEISYGNPNSVVASILCKYFNGQLLGTKITSIIHTEQPVYDDLNRITIYKSC